MNTKKLKPKIKKFGKIDLFGKESIKHLFFKRIYFFLYNLIYLNVKKSNKLKLSFLKFSLNRKKMKLFFGFYKTGLLKSFFKKRKNFLTKNRFCSLLERRLDFLMFRIGLFNSLYEAKQFVIHKKVRINRTEISSYYCFLKKSDIISFEPSFKQVLQKKLIKQVCLRNLYCLNNVEVNFKMLTIIFLKEKILSLEHVLYYDINFKV